MAVTPAVKVEEESTFTEKRIFEGKVREVEVRTGRLKLTIDEKTVDRQQYRIEVIGDIKEKVSIHFENISEKGLYKGIAERVVVKRTPEYSVILIMGEVYYPVAKRRAFKFQLRIPSPITKCDACKKVYTTACSLGCSVGVAVICFLAGIITLVGGIACTGIAWAVCNFINTHGCTATKDQVCKSLGFCP